MGKKRTIRADFRKNRTTRTRQTDWTRDFDTEMPEHEDAAQGERISGKGDLTRKRTIRGTESDDDAGLQLEVDESCLAGRVLGVYGLMCAVEADNGLVHQCAVRRILKTLSTEQRHVVAAGDRVLFRPAESADGKTREGIIERIEPRHGTICRTSKGRQHILVTNVDQLFIVSSAAEPRLKPNFIDRMLVTAEKGGVRPIVCINKIDLVDPAALQPLVGVYSQMGYRVLLLSAETGFNVQRAARLLAGRQSVVVGQSGVGKSSLLNAIDPGLHLKVAAVSQENQKGRHTTTVARLLPLASGGYVVDTPGVRQFQLWDVISEEVPGFYRDIRPYVSRCRFPDCTHTHEDECAVKDAVADGRIDERRYESLCHLAAGDEE